MHLSSFLRTILKVDGLTSLLMAAIMLLLSTQISAVAGVTDSAVRAVGLSLFPMGAFILWLGTRRESALLLVALVIVGNLAWTAMSVVTALALPELTGVGRSMIIVQGLAVLAYAVLEWFGLRSSLRSATSLG